jgi:transcriptional regulator with XRE-family HTH domain
MLNGGGLLNVMVTMQKTSTSNSSDRLVSFLEDTNLHKKDFAEMIGVTLSYVYSLIGAEISFSSRTTTIERIAVVMGIEPDSFPEYKNSDEPKIIDSGVQFLKQKQQLKGLSNVQFIKKFPRVQRVDVVDMLRGALPLPLDWIQLSAIGTILEIDKEELYQYWEMRLQQTLIHAGLDPLANVGLVAAMFKGARSYINV